MADTARSDATGTQRATRNHRAPHGQELAGLSLAALGVVYGDIGTSPLYAMSECLSASPSKEHAIAPVHGVYDPSHVLGVLSLFFWALMLVVVIKYLVFVLRADNKGEGGILALAALVQQTDTTPRRTKLAVPILLALFGAGLLYGDGVITPAVSVLGALQGLSEQNPAFAELVVPIAAVILIGLFWVQRVGTIRIGAVFGRVMLLWFIAIGGAGLPFIVRHPQVLQAVSPHYAIGFLHEKGLRGWRTMN